MAQKRLVTEADVLAMAPGAELVLDAGTLATPAALDAAHRRGVRVVRPGEGGAASRPTASAPATLWDRMLAADGTYVVQVRAGRAVVTRLGDEGPKPFGAVSPGR